MSKNHYPFIGLTGSTSAKSHGGGYAERAEDCIVYGGVLEPRNGQHYLAVMNSATTLPNIRGIQPIQLTVAKQNAIVVYNHSKLFVYRGRRFLRSP